MSEDSPLRVRLSPSVKELEQEAVVRVRRSAWERVTERELLVGRLSLASRFPQYLVDVSQRIRTCEQASYYLTTAMLTGAVVLAR
jgi:hypothetical protein